MEVMHMLGTASGQITIHETLIVRNLLCTKPATSTTVVNFREMRREKGIESLRKKFPSLPSFPPLTLVSL